MPGLLALVLTLAFATWGFGHKFESASEVAAETYAAVYGLDANELCGGSGDHHAGNGCDACRLLAGFHLPEQDTGFGRIAELSGMARRTVSDHLLSSLIHDAARPARAPPLA
ncbi:MAG: polyketide synthase [Thalassovita sp.]|nr:polyketide synthase [Thalassovita sp.]